MTALDILVLSHFCQSSICLHAIVSRVLLAFTWNNDCCFSPMTFGSFSSSLLFWLDTCVCIFCFILFTVHALCCFFVCSLTWLCRVYTMKTPTGIPTPSTALVTSPWQSWPAHHKSESLWKLLMRKKGRERRRWDKEKGNEEGKGESSSLCYVWSSVFWYIVLGMAKPSTHLEDTYSISSNKYLTQTITGCKLVLW